MFRTALKPRWLALLALVLAAASVMAWLGQWQLDRAHQNGGKQQKQEQRRAPTPLADVLKARQTFPGTANNLPVSATGTWDGDHQLLVADRRDTTSSNGDTAGPRGFWVLTPLRLADGSAVPVVRGWVKTADDPAAARSAVPTGTITVTGLLQPGEPPNAGRLPGHGSGLPAGQVDLVEVDQLIKVWPYPLLTGYLLLTEQNPAADGVPTHLVALQAGDSALALQNLSYAVQWFLFAGFGCYLWFRLVREDHRGTLGHRAPAGAAPGPPATREPPGDDPARSAAEAVGDDGAPTPAVGGTHP